MAHFSPSRVRLSLNHDVTPDQISKVLGEIYRLSGCLACGIRGIDLILHGGDPETAALGKLPGVHNVQTGFGP